jgi:hypothetical protein
MNNKNIFGGFGVVYLQGLHAFVHLQNVWQVLEVRVTPMFSCFIFFSIFSYGRSVVNHCQENHGSSCFV